jgi:hypothetical protein
VGGARGPAGIAGSPAPTAVGSTLSTSPGVARSGSASAPATAAPGVAAPGSVAAGAAPH